MLTREALCAGVSYLIGKVLSNDQSSRTTPHPAPIVGRALLVSNDSTIVEQLTRGLQRFAISTDVCSDLVTAASLINTRKFEAIVVDLASGEHVLPVLERIRSSPSNQNSVTFAVVDSCA